MEGFDPSTTRSQHVVIPFHHKPHEVRPEQMRGIEPRFILLNGNQALYH